MKLLSLNIWGGRRGNILFDYIKEQSKTVDVFCFQEVFDTTSEVKDFKNAHPNLFKELKEILPDFESVFCGTYEGWVDMTKVDFQVTEGQAVFVKKPIKILEADGVYIYGKKEDEITEDFHNEPKNFQHVKLEVEGKTFVVANVHGKWYPGNKLDTPERIEQSRIILDFLSKYKDPKIVCGDFNLMPETESIKMFEKDFRNLIKDFKIENTRNEISWEHFKHIQKFADFAFTSPEVKVNSFEVPYNLVSDHLPLILQFKI